MIAREEKEEEKRQLPVTLLSGFLVHLHIHTFSLTAVAYALKMRRN
jgi:hypothetical protein